MFGMSEEKRNHFVFSIIFFGLIYTVLLTIFIKVCAPKKLEDCVSCRQAIANYKASQEARLKKENLKYQENLYNQGGGINPGFKQIVSKVPVNQEAPRQRAYEQQLAEYQQKMAEIEQQRLEEKRKREEIEAQEKAQLEKERLERLQQQQALQKTQAAPVVGNNTGSSKTFTPIKPSNKQSKQQKTVIGTLKTSKLGESSFQK